MTMSVKNAAINAIGIARSSLTIRMRFFRSLLLETDDRNTAIRERYCPKRRLCSYFRKFINRKLVVQAATFLPGNGRI